MEIARQVIIQVVKDVEIVVSLEMGEFENRGRLTKTAAETG